MPTTPPNTIECYIPVLLPAPVGTPANQPSTGIVIHAQEDGAGMLVIFGNRSSATFNDLSMPAFLWQAQQNGGQYLQGKLDLSLNRPSVDLRDPARIQAAFNTSSGNTGHTVSAAAAPEPDIPGLAGEAERIRQSGVFDKGVRATIFTMFHKP